MCVFPCMPDDNPSAAATALMAGSVCTQAAVGGVKHPGRMTPVMDTLEAAQREIMALSGSDLKEALFFLTKCRT